MVLRAVAGRTRSHRTIASLLPASPSAMKIDFDGVQAFVAVAEHGGFGRAARELHLTQTALSRRIQKLEAWLGLKLLERSTRRVELTVVGREFLPRAQALVRDMTQAVTQLKDMSRQETGHFALACIPSMSSHVLPALFRDYAATHPGNRIRLLDGSSDEVRATVAGGQAELGIAIEGPAPDGGSALQETALFADPLVFICRSPHPLDGETSVRWTAMRDNDLIGISSFMATRVFMDYQLAKHGIRVQGRYEVQHHATAINLVAAGVGSAILPSSTFREGDRPGVRKIALTHPVVKRKVVLVQRQGATLSPAAAAFRSLIARTRFVP